MADGLPQPQVKLVSSGTQSSGRVYGRAIHGPKQADDGKIPSAVG